MLAQETKLCLDDPLTKPNKEVNEDVDDNCSNQNSHAISSNLATLRTILVVEEAIDPEPLGGICNEGNSEIAPEENNQWSQVPPGQRLGASENDLKQGKDRITEMYRDIVPPVVSVGEWFIVEKGPEDN